MDQSLRTLNFIFLSIVNGLFFFIGIFLNSIVIVALLKSNQHLKSLCSFMILVLTCVDLATVVVCHPLLITSAYIWWTGDYDYENIYHRVKSYSSILFYFSFMALLVMNMHRSIFGCKLSILSQTKCNKTAAYGSCWSVFGYSPYRKSPDLSTFVWKCRLPCS